MKHWTKSSWKKYSTHQQPEWPDENKYKKIIDEISTYPPLIFDKEAELLKKYLADASEGKNFVIQGGDPQGTGMGGPGYRFEDELPNSGEYQIGSLAMANAGPDTNGSQFFVITGPSGVGLPPSYSLFGQVIDGLEVAEKIQSTPTGPQDRPVEDVVIESVTISEIEG